MDPVTVGLLAALAGGAGGELGRQAWADLTALVQRPFRRGDGGEAPSGSSSGEAELVGLVQAPADHDRAQALSTALSVRAALDMDFRAGLTAWLDQAKVVPISDSRVSNTISGGTQHGPVLQGRDFTGVTFIARDDSSAEPVGDHGSGEVNPSSE